MNVTLNGVTYAVDAITLLDGVDALVLTPLQLHGTACTMVLRVPR